MHEIEDKDNKRKLKKLRSKADILYRWVRLYQSNTTVCSLIAMMGYSDIAVYGFTDIAKCLIYESINDQINVKYIVDKKGKRLPIEYPIIESDNFLGEDVDAVVVTLTEDDNVIEWLRSRVLCEVLSIEEIIYEL